MILFYKITETGLRLKVIESYFIFFVSVENYSDVKPPKIDSRHCIVAFHFFNVDPKLLKWTG